MRSIASVTRYFIDHPLMAWLKYSAVAFAGGFVFFVISLFSGQFDVTVPFNGIVMLLIVSVGAVLRFGLYRAAKAILGMKSGFVGMLAVLESTYFFWMLFVAWDVAHPEYSDGAFTMLAMMGHILILPIAALALTVIGITWSIRAISSRIHCARVAREWRNQNADPVAL